MPSAGSSIDTHAWKFSHEYSAVRSISAAWGAILSSQNWRITARNSRCSSLRFIGCMRSVCPVRSPTVPIIRYRQLLFGVEGLALLRLLFDPDESKSDARVDEL